MGHIWVRCMLQLLVTCMLCEEYVHGIMLLSSGTSVLRDRWEKGGLCDLGSTFYLCRKEEINYIP